MEIAVGALVSTVAPYIAYGLLALALWGVRRLPATWLALAKNTNLESLIVSAIRYGMNGVQGASKDKTIPVHLTNPIIILALQYAYSHADQFIHGALGEPEKFAEKVFAQLPLDPDATVPDFRALVDRAGV